jgi:hypothetical protein
LPRLKLVLAKMGNEKARQKWRAFLFLNSNPVWLNLLGTMRSSDVGR